MSPDKALQQIIRAGALVMGELDPSRDADLSLRLMRRWCTGWETRVRVRRSVIRLYIGVGATPSRPPATWVSSRSFPFGPHFSYSG
jgi:hypothetical protein